MIMNTDHVLKLAEIIREVDCIGFYGGNRLGAAALAEAILSHPASRWNPAVEPKPEELTDNPLGDLIDEWVQEAFRKKPYGCKHPTHTYVACKAFEQGRNHAARTALDQPKPEGLTDEEILNLSEEHCVSYTRLDGSVTYPYENDMNMKDDVLSFARALIAADRARWGCPAI
jgi:hypothetical protein